MNARPIILALALALAATSALACGGSNPGPEVASSASQATYAEAYPTELESATAGFGARAGEAKKATTAFATYPAEIKDPTSWPEVLEIYRKADEAGHSQAFVDRSHELEGARAFFDAEHEEIGRKVGGSANYVIKKKGCDAEVSGTVSAALKDAVDKQIDKRRRESSDVSLLLDRYKVSLGKENAATLERQSDDIARASYIVRVEMVERQQRLQRLVDDSGKVGGTMDDFVASEKAFQADKKTTDPERKASEERIAAMTKSKARLDASVSQAKALLPDMDKQIQAAQKDYSDAFSALEKKAEEKASAAK